MFDDWWQHFNYCVATAQPAGGATEVDDWKRCSAASSETENSQQQDTSKAPVSRRKTSRAQISHKNPKQNSACWSVRDIFCLDIFLLLLTFSALTLLVGHLFTWKLSRP